MRTRNLPGVDLVEEGIADLGAGVESVASLRYPLGGSSALLLFGESDKSPLAPEA